MAVLWIPFLQVCLGMSPVGTTVCPAGLGKYTLKGSDKCPQLVQKFKFTSSDQIEVITRKSADSLALRLRPNHSTATP